MLTEKDYCDMETKFNFNSAICTSREQSEKLLALGLKKETADCRQRPYTDAQGLPSYFADALPPKWEEDIPAWSLHRLLMMDTSKRKVMLIRCESDIYDVVIKKIEREIKEGCFNKEYLL